MESMPQRPSQLDSGASKTHKNHQIYDREQTKKAEILVMF